MPEQLKPDAKCPECGRPLEALIDETCLKTLFGVKTERVKRTLYHAKTGKSRRAYPCRQEFVSLATASRFCKKLEI